MWTTTADSPSSSSDYPEQTYSPSTTASLTKNLSSSSSFTPSPSSSSNRVDADVESALFVGSTKGYFGGLYFLRKNLSFIIKTLTFFLIPPAKTILITSACVVLLVSIIILVFLKLWVFSSSISPTLFVELFVICLFCVLCVIWSQKEAKCNKYWH